MSGDPKRIGVDAVAYGGFADVWQGDHTGKKVCIKVLRIALNDTGGLRKVRIRHRQIIPFITERRTWAL
jgi:hypothetical protein